MVTGVGKRSVNGIPVLRPAVTKCAGLLPVPCSRSSASFTQTLMCLTKGCLRYLASAGLRFEVDPNNRGVVNVLLGGSAEAALSSG